jgi:hypothetical protein
VLACSVTHLRQMKSQSTILAKRHCDAVVVGFLWLCPAKLPKHVLVFVRACALCELCRCVM